MPKILMKGSPNGAIEETIFFSNMAPSSLKVRQSWWAHSKKGFHVHTRQPSVELLDWADGIFYSKLLYFFLNNVYQVNGSVLTWTEFIRSRLNTLQVLGGRWALWCCSRFLFGQSLFSTARRRVTHGSRLFFRDSFQNPSVQRCLFEIWLS